ncbi:Uncharacterised protein [Slackia heliotrinireducens]|uniref:Uncharacterized protein n=1 Tax=Slackia heliotrinireducens (strain ATCC 29202 / DSM 20476 / NCTC 11029 / RHS 1) TaxID=471855 RepID=C7N825_SLAHD|nr:hypothetical protein [Slackia heliotrinireducens]ACV23060.1 hypothetical protein Shel_20480 [Slackia heliotrinireducens DSM 20476]VEH02011.1 Uncharacterised protein [Slackia heliotrinireducens]
MRSSVFADVREWDVVEQNASGKPVHLQREINGLLVSLEYDDVRGSWRYSITRLQPHDAIVVDHDGGAFLAGAMHAAFMAMRLRRMA